MKYFLVYDFSCLRVEFWEVPEGQHLDDVAGKYFSMDNEEYLTYHPTLEAAKAKATELLAADQEKVTKKLTNLAEQKVEAFRGRYANFK